MGGFRCNDHHKLEWHRPGKQAGYINLINKENSYDINYVRTIVYPLSRDPVIAYLGNTGHYLTSTTPCVDKQVTLSTLPFQMTNGEIIYSTLTALLPYQDLPLEARRCHIFPDLNKDLSSIGVLCDHGCIAHFDDNKVSITEKAKNRVLMQVGRDPQTGRYTLDIPTTSIQPKRIAEIPFLERFYANNTNGYESK